MKLLVTGDWHLRFNRPRLRIDKSYFQIQLDKISEILNIANKYECSYILQPGDFFDNIETSDFVKAQYIYLLLKIHSIKILCVAGQHDMKHHSKKIEKTPLAVMKAAGVLDILEPDCLPYTSSAHGCHFYGASWKQEIPKVKNKDKFNILLIHRMIVDNKLWAQQENCVYANHMIRRTNFDLIVSGDNHKSFIIQRGDKTIINCGSLMRTRIDQMDHKPVVYVYDTQDRSIEKIYLNIKPAIKVFDVEKVKEIKERNEELDSFVEMLDSPVLDDEEMGLDFVENLYKTISDSNLKIDQGVKDIIEEGLDGTE